MGKGKEVEFSHLFNKCELRSSPWKQCAAGQGYRGVRGGPCFRRDLPIQCGEHEVQGQEKGARRSPCTSHFILIITPQCRECRYFYPHFLDEVIETERDGGACQSHTAEPGFGLVCLTESQFSFLFAFDVQLQVSF